MSAVANRQRAIVDAADMREAMREAGRDPSGLYATAITGGCVLAEGEAFDSDRAKALAGPAAAVVLHNLVEQEQFGSIRLDLPGALAPLLERYRALYRGYTPEDARYLALHRGHLLFLRPDEAPLITADLIRHATITGTGSELRETIRALESAGFTQFSCHIRFGHEETLDEWAEVIAGL